MRRNRKVKSAISQYNDVQPNIDVVNWLPVDVNAAAEYGRHIQTGGTFAGTWLPFGADSVDQPSGWFASNYANRMTVESAAISSRVDRAGYDPGIGPAEVRRYMNKVSDLISGYHLLMEIKILEKQGLYLAATTSIFDSYFKMLQSYLNTLPFPQALYDNYVKRRGVFRLDNLHNRIRVVMDLPYFVKTAVNIPADYLIAPDTLAILIGAFAITMQNDGTARKTANVLKRAITTLKVEDFTTQVIHEPDSAQGRFLLDRLFNTPYYHSSTLGIVGSGIDPFVSSIAESIAYYSITGRPISRDIANTMFAYTSSASRIETSATTMVMRGEAAGYCNEFNVNSALTGIQVPVALASEEGYVALLPMARETTTNDKSTADFATFQKSTMSINQFVEYSVMDTIRDVYASFV